MASQTELPDDDLEDCLKDITEKIINHNTDTIPNESIQPAIRFQRSFMTFQLASITLSSFSQNIKHGSIFLILWGLLQSQVAFAQIPGIDDLMNKAIQDGETAGGVVLIGTSEKILHHQAYGHRQIEPTPEPATLDTIYDLASVTKAVVTATSVMKLVEAGKIELDERVVTYLPEFSPNGKDEITVRHLLIHTAGLIPDNSLADYTKGKEVCWERICNLKLISPVGEKFNYSDVGFYVLGTLVERQSGQSLDEFFEVNFSSPLEMKQTRFNPPADWIHLIAPCEKNGEDWIRGRVHDPRAFGVGGVAGHAGLFSTASDLGIFARAILNNGTENGTTILKPETIELMQTRQPLPEKGLRALGWDSLSGFSGNRGKGMSEIAIGHGGFTGTGFWIDRGNDLYVVVLCNRLHPDGKGSVNGMIGAIGTLAVEAIKAPEAKAE